MRSRTMEQYIKGQYRKSIFKSDSGYIIGIFKVRETSDENLEIYVDRTITFTGYFHELNDLDTYLFYGNLVQHEKYGEQFQVTRYERCMPEEKDAMVEFLTSSVFKGIGKSKAKKIVDTLGKDTFSVILENPSNLILIPTITEKNAMMLHNSLKEYESSYETIIALSEYGFSTKDSMLIYHYYKEKTLSVIDENVYQLVGSVPTITFKKVDLIALRNDIARDDIRRVEASICYMMKELSDTIGHCYFYYEELFRMSARVLGISISEDIFKEAISTLLNNGKVVVKEEKYYLTEMYEAECFIVRRFLLLSHEKEEKVDLKEQVASLEKMFSIFYNDEQKQAIINSYLKKFLIISGGPGTGKTTIMKAILELYKNMKKYNYDELREKVALLAPTGRAAKRMSEATFLPASTIHRFLKWNKETDKFQVNEYNKSNVEFVLIDEVSMIDTYLMANLLKGLSASTKVILVGDSDQLPSVGPGQVLLDLIQSKKLPVCYLTELYRQGKDSNIIMLAHDIKNGSVSRDIFNQEEDLTFIACPNDQVMEHMREISRTYVDYSYKNFQILAPMYKTASGIDAINQELQNIFNEKKKSKKEIQVGEVLYREGDKVIELTNMPEENVYNGDIGIISQIVTGKKSEIYIDYDGNTVKYTSSNFLKFKPAYAISIHKAQGSEFDVVMIPLVKSFHKMLYRKLIYTAVTRCKKKLYLIGDMDALEMAVKNVDANVRRSSIYEFLVNGIK